MTDNIQFYLNAKWYNQTYTKAEGEDVCILSHSNKICVVTLAEGHPIVRDKKAVSSVDYQFDNVNRLCNMVSGKGKRGAQVLNADSNLCRVTCDDASQYYIPCGMKCQLLETNDTLKSQPQMLSKKTMTDGYIAIVLPKLKEFDAEIKKLMTEQQYTETCSS